MSQTVLKLMYLLFTRQLLIQLLHYLLMETGLLNLSPLTEEEPEELCSCLGLAAWPLDSGILAIFCLCAPLGPGEYTKVSDFIARL